MLQTMHLHTAQTLRRMCIRWNKIRLPFRVQVPDRLFGDQAGNIRVTLLPESLRCPVSTSAGLSSRMEMISMKAVQPCPLPKATQVHTLHSPHRQSPPLSFYRPVTHVPHCSANQINSSAWRPAAPSEPRTRLHVYMLPNPPH